MPRASAAAASIAAAQLQILGDGLDAAATDAEIPDRRLALMFACAHPAIETGIRAPLILQVVLGLNAETIASAFLTSPAAMAKRLVRAKDKIRHAGIAFAIPEREELAGRLGAVLDAIYAALRKAGPTPGDRRRPPRSHRGSPVPGAAGRPSCCRRSRRRSACWR